MASDDPNYNAIHQTNVGCFGCSSAIDDHRSCSRYFSTRRAIGFLRQRSQRNDGPNRLLDELRLAVCSSTVSSIRRRSSLHTIPRYYAATDRGCGFEKDEGFLCVVVFRTGGCGRAFAAIWRPRFQRRNVDHDSTQGKPERHYAQRAVVCARIYNQAWEKNWGFVPFTPKTKSSHHAQELKPIAMPELALIAEGAEASRSVSFFASRISTSRSKNQRPPNEVWSADRAGKAPLL